MCGIDYRKKKDVTHLNNANGVRASVRDGRRAKANHSRAAQLAQLSVCLRQVLAEVVICEEPRVVALSIVHD